jgi:hypothetical protein
MMFAAAPDGFAPQLNFRAFALEGRERPNYRTASPL